MVADQSVTSVMVVMVVVVVVMVYIHSQLTLVQCLQAAATSLLHWLTAPSSIHPAGPTCLGH